MTKYASLQWEIEQKLAKSLNIEDFSQFLPQKFFNLAKINSVKIQIFFQQKPIKISYRCCLNFFSKEIGDRLELVKIFMQEKFSESENIQGWKISNLYFPSEEIVLVDLELPNYVLVKWLERLPKFLSQNLNQIEPLALLSSKDDFFPLEYAYARCCSLLRVAKNQGLIELQDWQLQQEVSWLNPMGNFQFTRVEEARLLWQLIDTLDRLYEGQIKNYYQTAIQLTQTWLDFYARCRMFGDIHNQQRDLAIVRLALTAFTRYLLKYFLEQCFQIEAKDNL